MILNKLLKPRWGRTIFYGWWLALLALILNSVMTSPVWGGAGIWITALELEFNWSRTQMALAFSLGQIEGSIVAPLVGIFVDRVGSRWVVFSGITIFGIGFVIFSFVTNLPMFYVTFGIIMLGASIGGWMPMMAALNKWFDRKRSFAMGIASSGFSLGGVILLPILAWSVAVENMGWQITARCIGVGFLVIAWPLSRLIRNRPEDYGQIPDGRGNFGVESTEPVVVRETGFTAGDAVRTRVFWLLAIGQGCSNITISTLTVHLVPSLVDHGFTLQVASFVWAVMLGISFGFQLIGGYIGDKVGKNVAMAIVTWMCAVGLCFAAFADNLFLALVFAVVYGIGFGARIPLSTAIRGEYFGRKAFGTIMGLSGLPVAGFMMAGPLLAGAMYDMRGNYFLAFTVLAVVASLGAFLLLFAKKPTVPAY